MATDNTQATETSLCSASYISCQRDTARICCCMHAAAWLLLSIEQQSIDISYPLGTEQQTCSSGMS